MVVFGKVEMGYGVWGINRFEIEKYFEMVL